MIIFNKFLNKSARKDKIGAVVMEKGEIKAVHDKDLEAFLRSLDEYDPVINGNRKCFFCGETITLQNILSIFPHEEKIEYCCKNAGCYKLLLERGKTDA